MGGAGEPGGGAAPVAAVAGLLLTGGRSRRMGTDKASLDVGGRRLAELVGERLGAVVAPALEVGPGRSGLPSIAEEPPGEGPLVALVAGWRALVGLGHNGPVLVVACDLPLVTVEVLRLLAVWPGPGSVVPVVGGARQPLCARWARADLERAAAGAAGGARSLQGFFGPDVRFLDEATWGAVAPPSVFADVDTPADLERLGLA